MELPLPHQRQIAPHDVDTFPVMSVADVHDAWREAPDQVRAGEDPARKEDTGATDFRGVFNEWMLRDQAGNKTLETVRRTFENNVLPVWADRHIGTIGRRDVLDVIDKVADRGAVIAARRLHSYLHRLFGWALGRGIVEINPVSNLPKPGSETKRDRVLSDPELIAVWNAASEIGHPYGPAVQLLILTGARREEIGQLKWSEIDGGCITLDGSRTKNGEPHVIPLSLPARTIIDALPRIAGSDFVFSKTALAPLQVGIRPSRS